MRSLIYVLFLSGAAWAEPGDLSLPARESSDPLEAFEVLDPSRACEARPSCVIAGAPDTVAAPSEPLASKRAAPPPPRFRRQGNAPWTLTIAAQLKRAALRGNAVFLLFDTSDKEAMAEGQYTTMYQAAIHAGRALAVRMSFHVDQGFRPGHTYRLRVVQLIGGKELELTETDFTLL